MGFIVGRSAGLGLFVGTEGRGGLDGVVGFLTPERHPGVHSGSQPGTHPG